MMALRTCLSRWRVRRAVRLIRRGRSIIEREERRWGLAAPGWCWRVPNTQT